MKLKIVQDEDASNPRAEFDHAGTMVCWHSRYNLGDKDPDSKRWSPLFGTPDEFREWRRTHGEGGIILSLSLLDHSGLHIWCGAGPHWSDSAGWDSGPIGYIYATRETILKEWGKGNRVTAKARELAEKCLRAEVEEYDQYLTGDVWCYTVEDDDGEHVDSCCGFYGRDYCEQQGQEALNHAMARAKLIEDETMLAGCVP